MILMLKVMLSPLSSAGGNGMVDKLRAELNERQQLEKLEEDGKLNDEQTRRLAELRAQDVHDGAVDELTRGPGNTGTGT